MTMRASIDELNGMLYRLLNLAREADGELAVKLSKEIHQAIDCLATIRKSAS